MTTEHTHPDWLAKAVFYEIYPQSFYDSNADGIGDIPGITAKLNYIKSLGCNALWINPCFESPFKDAGYDVSNYCQVAERYGSNADLVNLFTQAHAKGIHVLLDLVPGHTSEEHPWFQTSQRAQPNEFSDRYIWTNGAFDGYSMPFIGGESERDAAYILNFFKCQPALNYGFAQRDRNWQNSPDSPAARSTRQAMVDVMRFWLAQGCDGFRVDMANSLVKNDGEDKPETIKIWQEMLAAVKAEYPDSAFVSEWGVPVQALQAGFDMDFYLDWRWDGKGNGYNLLARNSDSPLPGSQDLSYFKAESGSSARDFLDDYLPQYEHSKDLGYFSFISCNHDTPRLAPRLDERERKLALAMFLTMPGVPFLYYGDEIGMRYRQLPSKEGGYHRTGSRTPMQWDSSANLGFSNASSDQLYLPVDPDASAPTVASESQRTDSLLAWIRQIIALRAQHPALQADGGFSLVAAPSKGRSLAYLRHTADQSERVLIAMNPSQSSERLLLSQALPLSQSEPVLSIGSVDVRKESLTLGPQSFLMLPLAGVQE
ncbi:alpha-amylase [Bombiscardovia nodaiensis]|uniref:Alpha-amylase n=1 Tax=Bombiscardovia nodaiensis TaxID=2932181 RepID=A0ABM8B7D4_9BIFI|nr:alpha-amylase [Bombiscardovia nodaiensis]